MESNSTKNMNVVLVSYCPVCGREMVWLPYEPVHPDADYMAFCYHCGREFGVSVGSSK